MCRLIVFDSVGSAGARCRLRVRSAGAGHWPVPSHSWYSGEDATRLTGFSALTAEAESSVSRGLCTAETV